MAAVYNVPLGGALFALEVLLGSLALPLVLPALLTSLLATAVAWIVNADGVVEPSKLELGPASGDLTVVNAGLSEGDRVVTDGQYKLQVNARVAITSPPIAANSPSPTSSTTGAAR